MVGFSPDQGYEKRCRWWAQHDVHWRASRRIAKGWHEWWAYTLRKRGATGFQRCFRGFRVRIRFKRKRDRALLRQAKQSATALMQRMGRGFCGRKAAAVRRKQMGTVQLLFSKQLFSRKERSIYTWKRNAKIKKSAKILRMRIFDRERLSRLRRFWDLWGEGIVKQVKACMTIQNSLLRVRVAVRERNRKRAQRRWDIRFGALVRLQSWWRGNSTRFRLLVQRFRRMPGALMVRARLLFRGGIGWKALGLIPNKSGGLGHTVCADEIGAATSAERKHDILEIRVPELPDPVQLLRDPRKINQVDKQRIIDALEFEDRGMGCWYEATESWKEATGALLRKGELTNDFELHVLERLMALERSRGEVFKCAELHKRAKRVCTNMLRAVQDYGHRADEIRDRLYLYRRRRQLLVELLRYRMAFPTLANPDRMACEDDRERRIEWWSVRQAMRQLGRVYESKRARQSELEASKHKAWKELSKDSVAAHAEWLQKDQAYRQAHAKLVEKYNATEAAHHQKEALKISIKISTDTLAAQNQKLKRARGIYTFYKEAHIAGIKLLKSHCTTKTWEYLRNESGKTPKAWEILPVYSIWTKITAWAQTISLESYSEIKNKIFDLKMKDSDSIVEYLGRFRELRSNLRNAFGDTLMPVTTCRRRRSKLRETMQCNGRGQVSKDTRPRAWSRSNGGSCG